MLLGVAMIAFVATVVGYAHFSRGGNVPDGVLLSSSVLESSGDDFVDAQANLALFSTQLRQYDLELERGWTDLTPVSIRPREAAEQTIVTQEGGGMSPISAAASGMGLPALSYAPHRSIAVARVLRRAGGTVRS
jgi:hypothetical protein